MSNSRLFAPLKMGTFELKHRVAMAPLTRFRADDSHVPMITEEGPNVAKYYKQRSSIPGTFIISEATLVHPEVGGYSNVPGIWSQAQIDQWHKITDTIHAQGSRIFLQLWALGRVGKPEVLEAEGGYKLKSASAIPFEKDAPVPEEMTEEDILRIVGHFRQAAKNAIAAGFDGVEVHGANGYLLDQFLQDVSNHRTDRWGGSIENRARFGLEVAKAIAEAIGAERVGYRVSPRSLFQGMQMEDPVPQFTYFVKELKKIGIAYLHAVISGSYSDATDTTLKNIDFLVQAWGETKDRPVLLAGGLTPAIAHQLVDTIYPEKNIIAIFGRHFIANPDLPYRIQNGIALNQYDRSTFYAPKTVKGYTDYPFSKEFEAAQVEVKA